MDLMQTLQRLLENFNCNFRSEKKKMASQMDLTKLVKECITN